MAIHVDCACDTINSTSTPSPALAVRDTAGAMGIRQQQCGPVPAIPWQRGRAQDRLHHRSDHEDAGRRITAREDGVYGADTAAPVAPGAPDLGVAAVPRGLPALLPVSLASN